MLDSLNPGVAVFNSPNAETGTGFSHIKVIAA